MGYLKTDIDGVQTNVLMQYYQRLGGPLGFPLKAPEQVCSINLNLEKFKKPECKDYNEKLDQKFPWTMFRKIYQGED